MQLCMEACACPRNLRIYRRYRHYDEEHLKAMLNREGIGAAKVAHRRTRTRSLAQYRSKSECGGRMLFVWSLRRVAGGYAARRHTG